MIQTPAIRYRQGEREVYAFALSLPELNAILPSRSDDRLNTIRASTGNWRPGTPPISRNTCKKPATGYWDH